MCVAVFTPALTYIHTGVVATCGVFLHDTTSFYVLRLLLGVFESGASPAMWYALSQFYPQER